MPSHICGILGYKKPSKLIVPRVFKWAQMDSNLSAEDRTPTL